MHAVPGDLDDERVRALLDHHVATARAATGAGSAHAMDHNALRDPSIEFFTIWDGNALLAIGALRELDKSHGELKSMHTAAVARGKGVGSAMLMHLVERARQKRYTRVSLETGSWDYFAPARALYSRHGFVACGPFSDYVTDRNSIFMTRSLAADGIPSPSTPL